ncbi:nucleoside diphosphate-linked moiety X motif 19-like isoform X2 [Limulus polyphemus]|uniref:Nucleoside diphosphate-linked moiety X motif 19-like isoform X2 n=1 Tax=Limulus polyphemus TaxID=6850 RepID=A0ABM1TMG8_LIMPO|nr:nucleoside diphosphate-linked moiety X motif 19-like isoform X2 [Limulus polyphemus]
MAPHLQRSSNSGVVAPPWKEATSLIMVKKASLQQVVGDELSSFMRAMRSPSKQKDGYDYRMLMVKRSSLSSFMSNAFVFPGGLVEEADFSSAWWTLFANFGVSKDSLLQEICGIKGPRPPMIQKPLMLSGLSVPPKQCLPTDLAYRIAAIRETFEETGVLIARHDVENKETAASLFKSDDIDLAEWRAKLQKSPHSFLELCWELKVCPDVWSLFEWSNWLTPTSVGHKRYDTMFYICCINTHPDVILDDNEVITLKWCSPMEMLKEFYSNSLFLAPPQVYELSRLLGLDSYKSLRNFIVERREMGVEQWLPVICTALDGAVSVLPGDDLYPKEPDYVGQSPGPDLPHTLDQLKTQVEKLHRMEIRGPISTVVCNIPSSCGHLTPLTYSSIKTNVHSSL